MRTIIDIPEDMLNKLDTARARQKCSRASLIREAIDTFLKAHPDSTDVKKAFGIWKDNGLDGMDYQEDIRREWETS
ncbi:ribbon-helix-helix protein, CopG family [Verrucomicrobia bacterium]|nr:ribbon-helix-helix protein, CopG family [Verrucomicrobiota bacterium]